jgi:hypothetical protein
MAVGVHSQCGLTVAKDEPTRRVAAARPAAREAARPSGLLGHDHDVAMTVTSMNGGQ